MNKNGPIIIIEDDSDDQVIFTEILQTLDYTNEVRFFDSGISALDYLNTSDIRPFIIISDVQLPKLSGIELRDKLQNNEQLRLKCVPYLFFTTGASHAQIVDAYSNSIQGFFIKPSSVEKIRHTLRCIIDYWACCTAPTDR